MEVVGVEPTSYAAAKKLSTYLVYLLFLNTAERVNTHRVTQKAKYSLKNTFRSYKECSVFLTPRPRPTDKPGATIVLKNEFTLQERSLHFYLHLNLGGMFYRSHSFCGMLILSLTGNRIQCTPIFCLGTLYYTHFYEKVNRFSAFGKNSLALFKLNVFLFWLAMTAGKFFFVEILHNVKIQITEKRYVE